MTPRQRIARAFFLQKIHTDAHGLASLSLPTYEALQKMTPPGPGSQSASLVDEPALYVTARDKDGHTGAMTRDLTPPSATFRITTPKVIYHPGDAIEIEIDAADESLPLTVQILRHTLRGDLTLATRDITLIHGHASLSLTSDQRYSGLVFISVIALGANLRDPEENGGYDGSDDSQSKVASRALLFPRDNSLQVGIKMSADTFAPGDDATASFSIRGPQELTVTKPIRRSALGVVAVDQAVEERNRTDNDFGGADMQPFFFHWRSEFEDDSAAGGFTLQALERLDPTQPLPAGAQLAGEILLAGRHLAVETVSNEAGQDSGKRLPTHHSAPDSLCSKGS